MTRTRAPRRPAPVPGVGRTQRRTEGSNRIFRDGEPPRFQNPVFPVYAGPGPFCGLPELSVRLKSFTRRQSRTGHGRTDARAFPPSSGLSAAPVRACLNEVQPEQGGSHVWSFGVASRRQPRPSYLTRLVKGGKRVVEKFLRHLRCTRVMRGTDSRTIKPSIYCFATNPVLSMGFFRISQDVLPAISHNLFVRSGSRRRCQN